MEKLNQRKSRNSEKNIKRGTKKKECGKAENFLRPVKQGPCYICTTHHQNLYQRSVKCYVTWWVKRQKEKRKRKTPYFQDGFD